MSKHVDEAISDRVLRAACAKTGDFTICDELGIDHEVPLPPASIGECKWWGPWEEKARRNQALRQQAFEWDLVNAKQLYFTKPPIVGGFGSMVGGALGDGLFGGGPQRHRPRRKRRHR